MKISVVVPASGAGVRFGGEVPKQFLMLGGEPILKQTLSVFNQMDIVEEIAAAVPKAFFDEVKGWQISKLKHIVPGEKTRAESVYAALKSLSANTKIVLIHDGIRPFVTPEIIEAVAHAAAKHGAAIACTPVTDTIKQADAQGKITATPDRATLWQAQTPQGFTYETILKAYSTGDLSTATDDSSLIERMGIPVQIVESHPQNIKITTQTDFRMAEALSLRENSPSGCSEKSSTKTLMGSRGQRPLAGEVGVEPPRSVSIFTDGACSGNPGPGGYGAILVYGSHRREISGGEPSTTNNRMEIMAVIKGLEMLNRPCKVALYSDSRYVVDAVEKGWAERWQKNGWMRNKKEPALNVDLWEILLALLRQHEVTFHWVKGHAGHAENERCDELARAAILCSPKSF